VLVAAIDGTPWSAESDATGAYRIAGVPPGRYAPVAGARGFEDTAIRRAGLFRIGIGSAVSQVDITLKPLSPPAVVRETNWSLSPAQTVSLTDPLPGSAVEHEVHYVVDGKPNQTTFYYTPVEGSDRLPTILAVYPGPADTWAQVSIPLAQAGFAVIAVGPAYALDLEPDVDDLQRLIARLQAGDFPRADPDRMGVIAGSYSSLHVFRLAERQVTGVRAILLLGPPTDLFELRRQFEAGTFFPPFGLDQVLVALGLPDRAPERYWRYSVRYHVRSIDVPVMLIHSKLDEIIPFTQSQLMADELQRLGKPYELHILEGMGHYLLEPKRTPAIDDLFRTTTDFFAHQLAAKP
jgi:dipeptidyl aminopeptidase/acylaminoacyl peptidase